MINAGEIPEVIFGLALTAASVLIAYWVIRLAVRHGIEDADRRRGT